MSLSSGQLKFLASLSRKKNRSEHRLFSVEGVKLAKEVLNQNLIEVEAVYALGDWISEHDPLLRKQGTDTFEISQKELSRISNLKTPNQVFVLCRQPLYALDKHLIKKDLTLFLDKIRDPGNLGTIIRIADWFGISQVLLSPESAEVFNPKTIQSTMGAIFRIKVSEISFEELKKTVPEARIFASAMGGKNIYLIKEKEAGVIVIGNESHGVSDEILAAADLKIGIPSHAKGGAESLNAAVAAGIICSVFRNSGE